MVITLTTDSLYINHFCLRSDTNCIIVDKIGDNCKNGSHKAVTDYCVCEGNVISAENNMDPDTGEVETIWYISPQPFQRQAGNYEDSEPTFYDLEEE